MKQTKLFNIIRTNPIDTVYTPHDVARDIVMFFKPTGKCLDPCKGDGAFLNYLPAGSDWCEASEGKDFFDYQKPVDWIISNPPYSCFSEWLDHSFEIAENIVYLIPINKPFNSYAMMERIYLFGGIKQIYVIAAGSKLNFPIGFAIGAVQFQSGYRGGISITFRPNHPPVQPSCTA